MLFKYPKASESVAYNVSVDGLLEGSNLDTLPRVNATTDLEPLSYIEAVRVHDYAYNAIAKYLITVRVPVLTELRERTWSLDSIGDPLGDRTLPVVFEDCTMVDSAFISFVQSDILTQFSSWRLLHCESSDRPELNLAVYPDAVSTGNGLPSKDASIDLMIWRHNIACFREPISGHLRRQLKCVQSAIVKIPPSRWRSSAPSVISAFDTHEGDGSLQAAWLMVHGKSPFDDEVDAEDVEDGNYYPVGRDGQIGEVMAPRSPTRLWVRQVSFPKQEPPGVLVLRRNNEMISTIKIQKFTSDRDLEDTFTSR